jgi:hypothetical protein
VTGVRARDRQTGGNSRSVRTSPSTPPAHPVDSFLAPLNISTHMPLLKAMNLVTRREAGDEALGGRTSVGRHLFLSHGAAAR